MSDPLFIRNTRSFIERAYLVVGESPPHYSDEDILEAFGEVTANELEVEEVKSAFGKAMELPPNFTGEAPPDALGRVYYWENGVRKHKVRMEARGGKEKKGKPEVKPRKEKEATPPPAPSAEAKQIIADLQKLEMPFTEFEDLKGKVLKMNPKQLADVRKNIQKKQEEKDRVARMREYARRDKVKKITDSKFKYAQELSGGIMGAQLITLENGERGVWKAESASIQREGFNIGNNYYPREVAASSLAGVLGLDDLVPIAVKRDGGRLYGGPGSLMSFVEGAKSAAFLTAEWAYDGPKDLSRAAAFDFLVMNTDRHQNNWLMTPSEDDPDALKMVLIDNALSFPSNHDRPEAGNYMILREAINREMDIPKEVMEWGKKRDQIRGELRAAGLNDDQTDLTMVRLDILVSGAERGETFGAMYDRAVKEGVKTGADPDYGVLKGSPEPEAEGRDEVPSELGGMLEGDWDVLVKEAEEHSPTRPGGGGGSYMWGG